MTDLPEHKTIWGSFPLPEGEEILQSWNQIASRTNNTAIMNERVPMMSDLGDRTTEFAEACPTIERFIEVRSKQVGEALNNQEAILAYKRGAADLLELLGTITLNRQFDQIASGMAEPPDQET